MSVDTNTPRDASYTASICLKTNMCIIVYCAFITLDKGPSVLTFINITPHDKIQTMSN